MFLDEIGDMPLELQAEAAARAAGARVRAAGQRADAAVDVRVIAATNRDLAAGWSRRSEFREDLFYRLNVFPIQRAAAARTRGGHPAARAGTSSQRFARRMNRTIDTIAPTRWRR